MSILYDSVPYNREILLDLPFREATGIVTQDMAKPHHPMVMANTPDWATLDSGLGVLDLNGTNEYLYCLAADCVDLDFTGNYSICGWIKWETGDDSQIVFGRYGIDTGGWELYLYVSGLLTIRHHHATEASLRTAAYCSGWTKSVWHFFSLSRTAGALSVDMSRNAEAQIVTRSVDGVLDPDSLATANMVIGVRSTLNDNYFKGLLKGFRAWDRVLSAEEWSTIYAIEKRWFE